MCKGNCQQKQQSILDEVDELAELDSRDDSLGLALPLHSDLDPVNAIQQRFQIAVRRVDNLDVSGGSGMAIPYTPRIFASPCRRPSLRLKHCLFLASSQGDVQNTIVFLASRWCDVQNTIVLLASRWCDVQAALLKNMLLR